MNFIFLMDPLHTVIAEKDTSLALMVGAHERGHKVFFLPDGGMTRQNGKTSFNVISLTPRLDPKAPFADQKAKILSEDDVDVIFVRSDPPFDGEYLLNTWLLDLLPQRIAIINNPSGIRTVNEKVWATQFTDLMPPTCITRNCEDMLAFIKKHADVIAKPTNSYGGQSIFLIKQNDPNRNVILETLSKNYSQEIIVQKFIPEAKKGDKRILLLNGELLGAMMRVQTGDDHRNNLFAGGKAQKADVNKRDREIISVLKPHLQKLGLYLVGIDILGDYLTEVNVTSPTCMQEINKLEGSKLHHQVIEFAENLTKKKTR
ncbi:MAG TPA: glutathione synthase [Candidatus Omnitrophota bacterium]|nr:glutathione synthase [Candidatus Omnitrophota bacterium]